jgi:Transglycosylase-like domain
MPRPPTGRVGRSAGAAEHHVIRHRIAIALSRTTSLTRATALGCVVALALAGVPAVAAAQASPTSVASIRATIDASANKWFAVQRDAADLDRRIQLLDKTLAGEARRVATIRAAADARAVQVYENSAQGLDTMFGTSPLEVGRRAALIGHANAAGQHAIDVLNTSVADLTARRDQLAAARDDLKAALRNLTAGRRALDSELATLQVAAYAAEHRLLASRADRAQSVPAAGATRSAPTSTTTAVALRSVTAPALPPAPPATSAVNPHHGDTFLACTRERESNGDYGAVSSSGYYGAYQFSRTTWDVTASHAGRLDLVGVLPSVASQYDQDDMAWSLYQWQGNAPWGGRC